MADWVSIADASLDPDAPITSGLGYAWRDNPIAIAEGASGAPRIRPSALREGVGGTGFTVARFLGKSVTAGSDATEALHVIAGGEFRISFDYTINGGANFIEFRRVRSSTVVLWSSTGTGSGSPNVTFDCIKGDILYFNITSAGAGLTSSVGNAVITSSVDGGIIA